MGWVPCLFVVVLHWWACAQVVNAARANAAALNSWWSYSPANCLCQQSGSGNNWAQGFHGYGPEVRAAWRMPLPRRNTRPTRGCQIKVPWRLILEWPRNGIRQHMDFPGMHACMRRMRRAGAC